MKHQELIEASKALSEKATKGPWREGSGSRVRFGESWERGIIRAPVDGHVEWPFGGWQQVAALAPERADDIAFIIHARTALPALVQGLEDALKVIEVARVACKRADWSSETGPDHELTAALAHFDARESGGAL